MWNFRDLTGQVFNEWTVLERDFQREAQMKIEKGYSVTYWLCRCSCGNIRSILASNITTNKTKSCGCKMPTPSNFIDLTGQKFNRLLVIDRDNTRKGTVYWNCICDCDNKVCVQAGKLISGHTKSCGCLQKEKANETHFKDLTGKKFGKLTVISRNLEYSELKDSTQTYWNCICDCGTKTVIIGGKLVAGHTKSCGCVSSFGELIIKQILNTNKIKYNSNYTFSDCISVKGRKYKFDFAIFENKNLKYLIEFDGEQHFINVNRGWMTDKSFKELQIRDRIKNKYCFDNNIPLIRIPYTRLQKLKLEDLILETSKYILTKDLEVGYYTKYSKKIK